MPPRSTQQMLAHAEDLADRLANDDLAIVAGPRDATPLRRIGEAVIESATAEAAVRGAVAAARAAGHTWAAIAAFLGTSAQAAQQKYG